MGQLGKHTRYHRMSGDIPGQVGVTDMGQLGERTKYHRMSGDIPGHEVRIKGHGDIPGQ